MDKRWKRHERAVAAMLGTTRIPSSGKAAPDMVVLVGGRHLSVESKSRQSLPTWLTAAINQAVRNAPEGSVPVVVLTAGAGAGKPCHRLAVVRLQDLPGLMAVATAGTQSKQLVDEVSTGHTEGRQ